MQNKTKIFILLLLIIAFVITNLSFNKKDTGNIKINVKDKIPLEIYGYIGEEQEIPEKLFNIINPEEILMRKYKKNDREINLAVVVSNNRDDLHAPEVCYKLQGFDFQQEEDLILSTGCKISKIYTEREKEPYIFHFWYTDTENVYKNRFEFVKNVVIDRLMNKTGKKYVLVIIFTEEANISDLKPYSDKINSFLLQ